MDEGIDVLFVVYAAPIIILHVKIEHFIGDLTILELTSIHDHGLSKNGRVMVLPRQDVDSFGFNHIVSSLNSVVNNYLVGALAHLPFAVKLKAASESVYSVIVTARSVPAPALNWLKTVVTLIRPFRFNAKYII